MRRTDMHTIANLPHIWIFGQPLLLVCGLQLYGQRVDLQRQQRRKPQPLLHSENRRETRTAPLSPRAGKAGSQPSIEVSVATAYCPNARFL